MTGGPSLTGGSRVEVEMELESFEFDALDAPMPWDRSEKKSGPADTQAVSFGPCGVCGVRVFSEEGEEPPSVCLKCDHHTAATTAELLLKGRRLPRKPE